MQWTNPHQHSNEIFQEQALDDHFQETLILKSYNCCQKDTPNDWTDFNIFKWNTLFSKGEVWGMRAESFKVRSVYHKYIWKPIYLRYNSASGIFFSAITKVDWKTTSPLHTMGKVYTHCRHEVHHAAFRNLQLTLFPRKFNKLSDSGHYREQAMKQDSCTWLWNKESVS